MAIVEEGEIVNTVEEAKTVLENPSKYSVQQIKDARNLMNRFATLNQESNRTKMADGGMASGKKHMYLSAGAAVVDNLPNKGTRALAKTTKGREALKNMGLLK